MNSKYTAEMELMIRDSVLTDQQLTDELNMTFGLNLAKAAVRKKRQRLGVNKSTPSRGEEAGVCQQCMGTGWIWGHQLEVPDWDTDNRYACPCQEKLL